MALVGTPGFVGARLRQVREARGLTAVALSEMVGVHSTSVSNYERDQQSPSPDVLLRLSTVLNKPKAFFLKKLDITAADSPIFPRSMSAATKSARARAEARFVWLLETAQYLKEYLDFPQVNLPAFNAPSDIEQISFEWIEDRAKDCRQLWNLGDGPIADMVLLLENNGVVVSRGELGAETLNAFSQWPDKDDCPYVFLGSDKDCAVRSRFDAAHELAHLLFHRHVTAKQLRNSRLYRLLENQAHYFAGALLLPERGFTSDLWAPSLNGFLALKSRWKVAISAMIKRCHHLEILDDQDAKRLFINLSRRGWRKREPLDDDLPVEMPRLLPRSFKLLFEEGIKSPEQVLADLSERGSDLEDVACLRRGVLSGEALDQAQPRLKTRGNVFSIKDRWEA